MAMPVASSTKRASSVGYLANAHLPRHEVVRLQNGQGAPFIAQALRPLLFHVQDHLAKSHMIKTLSLFQVRLSKFAILIGDALAFGLAFLLATLINVEANVWMVNGSGLT